MKKPKHHLGFFDLFKLSLRIFRTNPLRMFLTILGMAVGIGVVLFLVSLGFGLQYILIGKMVKTEESLVSLEAFYPEEGINLTERDLKEISNFPESEEVSPVMEFLGEAKSQEFSASLFTKIVFPNYFRLSGNLPQIGKPFQEGERGIVISNTALRILGLKEDESSLGKEVSIKINIPKNEAETKLVEIPEPLSISGIIIDEYSPPSLFFPSEFFPEKPDIYSRVFVKAKDVEKVEALREKLIDKGLLVSAKLDLVRQAKRIMNIITIVLGVFGVSALIVAGIGMLNVMLIGFLERIFEVGIMKAIGATSVDIRNLFLMESVIVAFLGGIGGIFLGILAGEGTNAFLNFLAKQLGGEPVKIFIYPWQFIILILAISIITGFLAGFWPAKKAAQLSAREAFLRR